MPGHFSFFTETIIDSVAWFSEQETKHAIQVLRYSISDEIEFTDGLGSTYTGKINTIDKKQFSAEIISRNVIPRKKFTLCVGKLKSTDRMEWLVEKCTELSVSNLVILQTKNVERSFLNLDKLRKTAISALKQSHGANLPEILEMNYVDSLTLEGKKFIAACNENETAAVPKYFEQNSIVYIGPEGDFTQNEVDLALNHGATLISLGNTILRTETAAVTCAAKSVI